MDEESENRFRALEERIEALQAQLDASTAPRPAGAAGQAEFALDALRTALVQLDAAITAQAEKERATADRALRERTSLAEGLEKALTPLPGALQELQGAVTACLPVIGETGLQNLSNEIPSAITIFTTEIRTRAEQTLAGTAPATLPKPFVPEVIVATAPPPETTEVFALANLHWGQHHGVSPNSLDAHHIGRLPAAVAKVALARNLAITPNCARHKGMREEAKKTGWPHLYDAQRVYDLDRDPNTVTVYRDGRKVREEPQQQFTPLDRGPPRQVLVEHRPAE
jgi:hypothetical protein